MDLAEKRNVPRQWFCSAPFAEQNPLHAGVVPPLGLTRLCSDKTMLILQ
jgi:hypothetical protein